MDGAVLIFPARMLGAAWFEARSGARGVEIAFEATERGEPVQASGLIFGKDDALASAITAAGQDRGRMCLFTTGLGARRTSASNGKEYTNFSIQIATWKVLADAPAGPRGSGGAKPVDPDVGLDSDEVPF